jgi:hypothetical protein
MVSGHPFLTGSGDADPGGNGMGAGVEDKIEFPFITQKVTVIASGSGEIRVSFASQGTATVASGRHYVALTGNDESVTFEVKCKEIYIKNPGGAGAGYQLIAELTSIPTDDMYTLTGDGITTPGDGS